MMYFRRIARTVFIEEANGNEEKFLKIKVCDGSFGVSDFLFHTLKLSKDEIVQTKYWEIVDQLDFGDTELLFVDDLMVSIPNDRTNLFVSSLNSYQHSCILFQSMPSYYQERMPGFEVLFLNASLRATVDLTNTCERFRQCFLTEYSHLPCIPKHNLFGQPMELIQIDSNGNFVQRSVKVIQEHAKASQQILVSAWTSDEQLDEIKSKLKSDCGLKLIDLQCENEQIASLVNECTVIFSKGLEIDGCEFETVILLISDEPSSRSIYMLPNLMFISMTRATTKLVILTPSDEQIKTMAAKSLEEEMIDLIEKSSTPLDLVWVVGPFPTKREIGRIRLSNRITIQRDGNKPLPKYMDIYSYRKRNGDTCRLLNFPVLPIDIIAASAEISPTIFYLSAQLEHLILNSQIFMEMDEIRASNSFFLGVNSDFIVNVVSFFKTYPNVCTKDLLLSRTNLLPDAITVKQEIDTTVSLLTILHWRAWLIKAQDAHRLKCTKDALDLLLVVLQLLRYDQILKLYEAQNSQNSFEEALVKVFCLLIEVVKSIEIRGQTAFEIVVTMIVSAFEVPDYSCGNRGCSTCFKILFL